MRDISNSSRWRLGCHGTCGLVAMTSASHAEGRQFDPGQVYRLLPMGRMALRVRLARLRVCVCGCGQCAPAQERTLGSEAQRLRFYFVRA